MNDQYSSPIVGKKLLQMLMLQLYSNPRCIYREYIQNALDSINEAVKEGILKQRKDGLVSINIVDHDITILDNGTGIRTQNAPKVLMDIANSMKNGIDTAGQFGVGRLSGGGYCEQLEFTTSYLGENVSASIIMDIKHLRRILSEENTDISAEQVMNKICSVTTSPENVNEHYFKVVLHNIINSADILLNKEDILSYIRQTAPIGYSTIFQTLINSCPQRDFAQRHKQIERIRVSLNECSDVEKSYGLKVIGSGDEISRLRYFELPEHPKYGKLAWGWYAVTPFTKQIDDQNDENVGIRLRKHNISLDKNILSSMFKEPRGNRYFYGEIFITNEKIEPDSGRQGLSAGEEADALTSQLREYFRTVLHQVYTKANRYKGLLGKIKDTADRADKSESKEAKCLIAKQLEQTVKDFQKATEKTGCDEINDVIDVYKHKFEQELQGRVTDILVNYGSTETEKGDTPSNCSSNDTYTTPSSPSTDYAGEKQGGNSTHNHGSEAQPPTPEIIIDTVPQGTQQDNQPREQETTQPEQHKKPKVKKSSNPLEPLIASGKYSEEQIDLLNKVYKLMGLICTGSEKKKLTQLMEWAVNNIVNNSIF